MSTQGERPGGPISRIVGVYQIVLRRTLEHFFPGAQLEILGDRSIIDWDGSSDETYFRLHDDPSGTGVEIEWLGTRLAFQSGNPMPLLALGAPDGRGDRGGDRPPVPRPAQPGAVPPPRPVQLPDRGPDRRRLPRGGQPVPGPGRARGAAGRGAVDLREPSGLDGRDAAGHRARPGRAGSAEPRRAHPISTPG